MNRRDLLTAMLATATATAVAPARAASPTTPAAAGRTGPRNLITDVPGLKIGQAQDEGARTGVTVILPDEPAIAAVDVRGGGPGTREVNVLDLENLVHTVDAITLSGGSVYGLAAADGVVAWLGAKGRGYGMANPQPAGVPKSPIVPGAILFDLPNGGNKNWGLEPPYRRLGIEAVEAAAETFSLGTAGAGYGAGAGALKGGIGSASTLTADGITVGAIVAVNSFGSVVVPGSGNKFWAAPYEIGKEFGGLGTAGGTVAPEDWGLAKYNPGARQNTTIACVATDVILSQPDMKRVAMMAQDALARAIRPVHAPFDGDVVFALSTGRKAAPEPTTLTVARIGAVAADTLARAIARAVYEATPWPGSPVKSWKQLGS